MCAFRLYGELHTQKKALEAAMEKQKGVIAEIREETGEAKLELDGYTTQIIAPTRSKFNPAKFVRDGGDLSVYNGAMETVPVKAYEKVSLPNEKDEER